MNENNNGLPFSTKILMDMQYYFTISKQCKGEHLT